MPCFYGSQAFLVLLFSVIITQPTTNLLSCLSKGQPKYAQKAVNLVCLELELCLSFTADKLHCRLSVAFSSPEWQCMSMAALCFWIIKGGECGRDANRWQSQAKTGLPEDVWFPKFSSHCTLDLHPISIVLAAYSTTSQGISRHLWGAWPSGWRRVAFQREW